MFRVFHIIQVNQVFQNFSNFHVSKLTIFSKCLQIFNVFQIKFSHFVHICYFPQKLFFSQSFLQNTCSQSHKSLSFIHFMLLVLSINPMCKFIFHFIQSKMIMFMVLFRLIREEKNGYGCGSVR